MSDWLHCNVCLRLPREETDVPFFFTSCGHVLCGKCSNREHVGKCRVCGLSSTLLQIDRNMRSDVQIFFRDPKDLVKRYVDNVIAVLDFQNGHRSRLNKAQLEQERRTAKLIGFSRADLNSRTEERKKLAAQMDALREEADKLRHRCQQLETLIYEYEIKSYERIGAPKISKRSPSVSPAGSDDLHYRSLQDFSFPSSDISNTKYRSKGSEMKRRSELFELASSPLVNESTEQSSAMTGSILTTPSILGVKNSPHSERMHRSNAYEDYLRQPFVF
uniref:RING-type domain-containing protein n=2 Tax=Parascaris univalens TaxID=6257 RepID=A0A915BT02_PARUN